MIKRARGDANESPNFLRGLTINDKGFVSTDAPCQSIAVKNGGCIRDAIDKIELQPTPIGFEKDHNVLLSRWRNDAADFIFWDIIIDVFLVVIVIIIIILFIIIIILGAIP